MKKCILSLLLSAITALLLLPSAAFAAETTAATELVINVGAKLSNDSAVPSTPIDCTLELTAVKKIVNNVESVSGIPMPESNTLKLTAVGKDDVNSAWTIPLSAGVECGTYYYTIKQTTTAANNYNVDDTVWYVTAEITKDTAAVTSLRGEADVAEIKDTTNFDVNKTYDTEATVTADNSVTTLTLGGNTIVNGSGFNNAVIRSKFTINFTKDFVITGKITPAGAADGSFIGFVPGGDMPEELRGGGNITVYETPEFAYSILFELDAWGNSEDFADDWSHFDSDSYGSHFALMQVDEYGYGYIVDNQYSTDVIWDTELPYTITLDTKGTSDCSDDILTFNVNNGQYNYSFTNPISQFGQKNAYFFLGGSIRYGTDGWYWFPNGQEVGDPSPKTSITFESFQYIQKPIGNDVKAFFTNDYTCSHGNWTYEAATTDTENDTVKAKCTDSLGCKYADGSAALNMNAPASGSNTATFDASDSWISAGLNIPTIYYKGTGNTAYDSSATPPVEPGTYAAYATFGNAEPVTISVEFTIAPTIIVSQNGTNPKCGIAMSDNDFFTVAGKDFFTAPTLKLEWKYVTGETVEWKEASPNGITANIYGTNISVDTTAALSNGDYIFRVTNGKNEFITGTTPNPGFVSSGEIKLTVDKGDSSATPPAANILTYNGSAQELVTAGTANGGTMQYAVSTDASAEPLSGWSTSIPKGIDAKEYYVWYRVKGDENHNDSDAAYISATIGRKDITVTITPNGGTYNGTITAAAAIPVGLADGDSLTVNLTYTSAGYNDTAIPVNAGTYTVTASLPDSAVNYNLTGNVTGNFVIEKAVVNVPVIAGKIYTGSTLTADVDVNGKPYEVTANEGGIQIGTYDVVLTLTDTANYKWSDSEEASKTVKFQILAEPEYAICGYSDANGNTVTADLENAVRGTRITLTISAAARYKFRSLTVTDAAGNTVTVADDNTFTMPGSEVTVNAVFKRQEEQPVIVVVPSEPEEPAETEDTEETAETEEAAETEENADTEEPSASEGNKEFETGINPITEKEDALLIDELLIVNTDAETAVEADSEAVTAAIVEAIETAIAENNTVDFILKADEKTVTEQGIENKAYADAAAEANNDVTKPFDSKTVTLESEVMETLANAESFESLTVMTSVADIEIDAQTLKSINSQSDGSIQLVVTLVKEEIAKTDDEGNKVYFDVSLVKENGTKITGFDGGSIKVTLPIPKAIQNEKTVVVYSDEKGHYSPVNGTVNSDGTFTFITSHLSEYVLMTQREAETLYNYIYDYATLKVHVADRTENSITIDWDEYEDAEGYIIYGSLCNSNGVTYKVKKLATIKDRAVTEYTVKDLKEGARYKFRIKAYKVVNGKKYVTVKSYLVHTATIGGPQKLTSIIDIDQTGMKKANTLTLKTEKTYTVKAKLYDVDGAEVHHIATKYQSLDPEVATVSLKGGKITAVGKGTCTILAIAENGICEEINVTVK